MKVALIAILLSLGSLSFSATFSEPYTGLMLEIPDAFQPCEDSTYVSSCPYWYAFIDSEQNLLTIEIEEYDKQQTLSEHFHRAMTETDLLIEKSLVCEDLEFCNKRIGDTDFTKLKVRMLALTETGVTALCLCDYLFVHDHFGITISLIEREVDSNTDSETEKWMTEMLESIQFSS